MKTILASVPPWYPNQPYLSIPLLTGILRNEGYRVYQRDINLSFFDNLLSEKELVTQFSSITQNSLSEKEKSLYTLKDYFINNVFLMKSQLRDLSFYKNKIALKETFEDIDLILKTYQLNYNDLNISLGYIEYNFNHFNPNTIIKYIDDSNNLFKYYFEKYELDYLLEIIPDIFGISITIPEQLIPALSFAKIIKQYSPPTKILLGGDYISRIYEKFVKNNFFDELYDFILIGETEESIKILFKTFFDKNNNIFDNVPNLIWKDKSNKTHINNKESISKYSNNVYPDFDGLELDKYFTPKFIIPIEVSKGCYWGKCKFCEIAGKQYFQKTSNSLLKEIKFLSAKYNTNYFSFVSSAPSPKLLKILSNLLIKENIKIYWSAMLRLEPYIDNKFAETLYNGGMKLAMIGIESGSQKTLDAMNKGLSIKNNNKILRLLSRNNIFTHCYFMLNYENEDVFEQKKTFEFIQNNRKYINSLSITDYVKPIFKENDLNNFNIYLDNSLPKTNTLIQSNRYFIEDKNPIFHINTYLVINA